MNFDSTFSHKFFLNLSRRPGRRARCEEMFAEREWKVLRQPAVNARWLKSARGFESPGRYAHNVSTRLILRRAALAKAEAVFIFEDDVVLHPALEERLAEIELPDDWGIFYLGCQHHERPEVVAPGLVRATAPLDTHAWGVRAKYFVEVRRALKGKFWPSGGLTPATDITLSELVRRVPAYAPYPNLAWQREEESDIAGGSYANYDEDGLQHHGGACLQGLLGESLGGTVHPAAVEAGRQCRAWMWPRELQRPAAPMKVAEAPLSPLRTGERIAFLFRTAGPHALPETWQDYWRGHEDCLSVYSSTEERLFPDPESWLARSQIVEHPLAAAPAARVQVALLKAALERTQNRFFVFLSEGCIPVRPFRDLRRLLAIDGRSRFRTESVTGVCETPADRIENIPGNCRIPAGAWRFHAPQMLLNREAAELLVANERLLDSFDGTDAAGNCALGTILNITGYPLGLKVAGCDISWHRRKSAGRAPEPLLMAGPSIAGDIAGSGCFFAGEFEPGSNIGDFGLHRDA